MRPFGVNGARHAGRLGGELAPAALDGGCDTPPRGGRRPRLPGSMAGPAASAGRPGCRWWPGVSPGGFAAGSGACRCGGDLFVHPLRPSRNPCQLGVQPAVFPRRLRDRDRRGSRVLPHRRGGPRPPSRRRSQQFCYQRVIRHRAAIPPPGDHRQPATEREQQPADQPYHPHPPGRPRPDLAIPRELRLPTIRRFLARRPLLGRR